MKELILAALLGLTLFGPVLPTLGAAYLQSTKFDSKKCQLKLYGVKDFRYENDHFDHSVKVRKTRLDRSLETLGMLFYNTFKNLIRELENQFLMKHVVNKHSP